MSALSVLGLIGTALTAFFMIPHLMSAMRDGFPHGTTLAWGVMVIQAAVWAAYGIIDKDPLVTAPTLISGPIAVILAVWTYRHKKLARVE